MSALPRLQVRRRPPVSTVARHHRRGARSTRGPGGDPHIETLAHNIASIEHDPGSRAAVARSDRRPRGRALARRSGPHGRSAAARGRTRFVAGTLTKPVVLNILAPKLDFV